MSGHNALLPCAHPCTQTTHALSTVRLYAVHAAVSSATGVTGVHFSCATSAANRLAEGRGRQSDSGDGRLEGQGLVVTSRGSGRVFKGFRV